MPPEDQQRITEIGQRQWYCNGQPQPLLSAEETYNFNITKGTLTTEERQQINGHITTQRMLEARPFPSHLRKVPEIAGGHHERMDGKGYPRGLKREEMPVSQALAILERMKEEQHIDPNIFDIFVRKQVYLSYAKRFLSAEQREGMELPPA